MRCQIGSALSPSQLNTFMDYVQLHERMWGLQNYPNRPGLAEILQAPIVILWYPLESDSRGKAGEEPRFTLTLHKDLEAVQEYIWRIVFRARIAVPKFRLWKIFSHGKEIRITGMKLSFG